jgi:hypothetical protein
MDIKDAIRKLRLSDNSVKSKAFDIVNNGFKDMESDEYKSKEIDSIIHNWITLDNYKLDNIIKLIEFADKIELKGELYDKVMNEIFDDVPVEKYGVHRTHCCVKHGCKYGNPKCPVELGLIVQDHPCENCGYDEFRFFDF